MDDKKFTTYEQQIEQLKSEKNLTIEDEDFAKKWLKKTSYFALINGYKEIFKQSDSKYIKGTCFEDIVNLYLFDENLRTLILKNILIVERQLKSLLSYYFSEAFTNEQKEYFNRKNYNIDDKKINDKIEDKFIKFLGYLGEPIKSDKYKYITHYNERYNNLPLWVLINALSFGNVSIMFSFCKQKIQQKVCNEYTNIKISEMCNMLLILTKFRNVCAHNERLFNYRTRETLRQMEIHKNLNIQRYDGGSYKQGECDLFAVVISFRCMQSSEDFSKFYKEIENLIDDFEFKSSAVKKEVVLNKMGFPADWTDIQVVDNNPIKIEENQTHQ